MTNQEYARLFNIRCAEYMGIETNNFNLGYGVVLCYAPTRDGWDNPEPYDPWGNNEQLLDVMDKFMERENLDQGRRDALWDEIRIEGILDASRNMLADVLITDHDLREQDFHREVGLSEDMSDEEIEQLESTFMDEEHNHLNDELTENLEDIIKKIVGADHEGLDELIEIAAEQFSNAWDDEPDEPLASFHPYESLAEFLDAKEKAKEDDKESVNVRDYGCPQFGYDDAMVEEDAARHMPKMGGDFRGPWDDDWLINTPPVGKEFGAEEEPLDFVKERRRLGHIPYGGCRDWRGAYDIELKFNQEAARLKHLYHGSGYCLDLSTWDPWLNDSQLYNLVHNLDRTGGMRWTVPDGDNLEDAAKDYIMVWARTPELEERLMKRLDDIYNGATWYDRERFVDFIDGMRVENGGTWYDYTQDTKYIDDMRVEQVDDEPPTVGEITHLKYHAADILVKVGYAKSFICDTTCNRYYLIFGDVIPQDYRNECEEVNYDKFVPNGLRQQYHIEHYLRHFAINNSMKHMWQEAVDKNPVGEAEVASVSAMQYWRVAIVNACLHRLVIESNQDFNEMCRELCNAFNVEMGIEEGEKYDPYNDIEALAPIIEMMARRCEEFKVPCIPDDYSTNVLKNMRWYVRKHGPELIEQSRGW